MKRLLSRCLTLLCIGLAIACSKDDDILPTDQDIVLKDVPYGPDQRHRIDVYLPARRNPETTKILVYIHGGGWMSGSKDDLNLDSQQLQLWRSLLPDVALVTLNYRLVTGEKNRYPAAEEDIVQAMNHLFSKLHTYQLSSRTYMSGGSAGAHLAALYSLKHDQAGRVRGCIGLSGPYDLRLLYEQGGPDAKLITAGFLGGTPENIPEIYHDASPVNFVTPHAPKFLIVHGRNDELTPLGQAELLMNILDRHHIPYSYFFYNGGHNIPAVYLPETLNRIKAFID